MKKSIIILITFLSFHPSFAQDKKLTKTGKVTFEASVPSFEEVKGTNESVTCILNIKTGEIASLALIKGFRFKIALMEEHFNENYMESDTYPKATFKGVIQGFNWNIIGTSSKEFKMKGTLVMHGRGREINTTVKLRKIDDALEIISDFNVNSEDFRIKIPEVVSKKVAKIVSINCNFLVK